MPFTPTDEQKQQTTDLLFKWQMLLFLNSWELQPQYAEDEDTNVDDGDTTRADIVSDPRYHKAVITFYPAYFTSDTFSKERAVVHELVHCLVEPMQEQIKDLQGGRLVTTYHRRETMERCVTHIANAFQAIDGISHKSDKGES